MIICFQLVSVVIVISNKEITTPNNNQITKLTLNNNLKYLYCSKNKLTELNLNNNLKMETKQIKIEVPQGYEIDKEKSTFENIILNPIEGKLPLSVKEIQGRSWYICSNGKVTELTMEWIDLNQLSTETRAKAFLALMQLVELRDAWNGEWKVDWMMCDFKYCIAIIGNKIHVEAYKMTSTVLHFKSRELAEKFLTQFENLINEAKELL